MRKKEGRKKKIRIEIRIEGKQINRIFFFLQTKEPGEGKENIWGKSEGICHC